MGTCPPLYSVGSELTQALVNNVAVARVLDRAREADIIFASIGQAELANPLIAKGMLTPKVMKQILRKGGVGDILANFYDEAGNEVIIPEFEPVGLRLDDVRAAKRVIGVAAGLERVPAIRAALEAGFVSELITDDKTAEGLLAS